jgi:energy-converting hydrogenase Eha subunit A
MKTSSIHILLIALLLIGIIPSVIISKCTDRPECFKKKMFNFNFPEMNLFPITAIFNAAKDFSVKAYGDFNNDL